jgi:hypothetical protein
MDHDIRKLQRLAEQGDVAAQEKLRAHEVRLRGFPLGPWDDPEWFSQFEQAIRHFRYPLHEGESLYASSTYGYVEAGLRRLVGRGPVTGQITRTMSSVINAVSLASEFKARGMIWIDHQTHTYGRGQNYYVDGFWATFEGDPGFLWKSCYTPFGDSLEAKKEILEISKKRNLPIAECVVESLEPLRIVLSEFRVR